MSLVMLLMLTCPLANDSNFAHEISSPSSMVCIDSCHSDSLVHWIKEEKRKKHHTRAIIETAGVNLGLLAFNKFVQKEYFANVTWKTIGRNINPKSWYWDSDVFRTNLLFHPYHGALYHQAARSNGMSFYEAMPYSIGGSLMWEIAGELEHPSLNDFISTSVGGWAIGEVTHRVATAIHNKKSKGAERVMREIVGAAVSPMGGFNRLITGESFDPYVQNKEKDVKMTGSVAIMGHSYGWTNDKQEKGGVLKIDVNYGEAINKENCKPYDFFHAHVGIDPMATQAKVAQLNIVGQLKNWYVTEHEKTNLGVGLYQHFDYYAADANNLPLYKISEAASGGVGLIWNKKHKKYFLQKELYLNAVMLGGALSDYHENKVKRDYSVGSGYSIKSITTWKYANRMKLNLWLHWNQLYSWKGYEDEDNTKHYLEYSVMGDRGKVLNLLIQPEIAIRVYNNFSIVASGLWVYRHFKYKYHPHKKTKSHEIRIGVSMDV